MARLDLGGLVAGAQAARDLPTPLRVPAPGLGFATPMLAELLNQRTAPRLIPAPEPLEAEHGKSTTPE